MVVSLAGTDRVEEGEETYRQVDDGAGLDSHRMGVVNTEISVKNARLLLHGEKGDNLC